MIFKKFLVILASILLSQILSSCNSGDGGSSEEGIEVTFAITHQQTPDATLHIPNIPAGARTFLSREGIQITLTKAYLVIWRIKLEFDCTNSLFTHVWPSLLGPFLSPAMAHTETTPTQLGIPNVVNLLAADQTELELGTIQPPPGEYCGVTVELLKADADAHRLPTDVNMVNRVLYLEGQYLPLGRTQAIPFTIDLAKTPLSRQLRLATPLMLSPDHRTARLVVHLYYDRWFDALNWSALEEDAQQDLLLNNIISSLHHQ